MIQKYKSIEKILEFLRYLEDREDNVRKDSSTCQLPLQSEVVVEEHAE